MNCEYYLYLIIYKYIYGIADIPLDVTCSDDTVGIALNGVQFKSPFDDIDLDIKQCLRPNNNLFPYIITELRLDSGSAGGPTVVTGNVDAESSAAIRSGGNALTVISKVKGNSCPIGMPCTELYCYVV